MENSSTPSTVQVKGNDATCTNGTVNQRQTSVPLENQQVQDHLPRQSDSKTSMSAADETDKVESFVQAFEKSLKADTSLISASLIKQGHQDKKESSNLIDISSNQESSTPTAPRAAVCHTLPAATPTAPKASANIPMKSHIPHHILLSTNQSRQNLSIAQQQEQYLQYKRYIDQKDGKQQEGNSKDAKVLNNEHKGDYEIANILASLADKSMQIIPVRSEANGDSASKHQVGHEKSQSQNQNSITEKSNNLPPNKPKNEIRSLNGGSVNELRSENLPNKERLHYSHCVMDIANDPPKRCLTPELEQPNCHYIIGGSSSARSQGRSQDPSKPLNYSNGGHVSDFSGRSVTTQDPSRPLNYSTGGHVKDLSGRNLTLQDSSRPLNYSSGGQVNDLSAKNLKPKNLSQKSTSSSHLPTNRQQREDLLNLAFTRAVNGPSNPARSNQGNVIVSQKRPSTTTKELLKESLNLKEKSYELRLVNTHDNNPGGQAQVKVTEVKQLNKEHPIQTKSKSENYTQNNQHQGINHQSLAAVKPPPYAENKPQYLYHSKDETQQNVIHKVENKEKLLPPTNTYSQMETVKQTQGETSSSNSGARFVDLTLKDLLQSGTVLSQQQHTQMLHDHEQEYLRMNNGQNSNPTILQTILNAPCPPDGPCAHKEFELAQLQASQSSTPFKKPMRPMNRTVDNSNSCNSRNPQQCVMQNQHPCMYYPPSASTPGPPSLYPPSKWHMTSQLSPPMSPPEYIQRRLMPPPPPYLHPYPTVMAPPPSYIPHHMLSPPSPIYSPDSTASLANRKYFPPSSPISPPETPPDGRIQAQNHYLQHNPYHSYPYPPNYPIDYRTELNSHLGRHQNNTNPYQHCLPPLNNRGQQPSVYDHNIHLRTNNGQQHSRYDPNIHLKNNNGQQHSRYDPNIHLKNNNGQQHSGYDPNIHLRTNKRKQHSGNSGCDPKIHLKNNNGQQHHSGYDQGNIAQQSPVYDPKIHLKSNVGQQSPIYDPNIHLNGQQPPTYDPNIHLNGPQPPIYDPNIHLNGPQPPIYDPNIHLNGPQPPLYDPNIHLTSNTGQQHSGYDLRIPLKRNMDSDIQRIPNRHQQQLAESTMCYGQNDSHHNLPGLTYIQQEQEHYHHHQQQQLPVYEQQQMHKRPKKERESFENLNETNTSTDYTDSANQCMCQCMCSICCSSCVIHCPITSRGSMDNNDHPSPAPSTSTWPMSNVQGEYEQVERVSRTLYPPVKNHNNSRSSCDYTLPKDHHQNQNMKNQIPGPSSSYNPPNYNQIQISSNHLQNDTINNNRSLSVIVNPHQTTLTNDGNLSKNTSTTTEDENIFKKPKPQLPRLRGSRATTKTKAEGKAEQAVQLQEQQEQQQQQNNSSSSTQKLSSTELDYSHTSTATGAAKTSSPLNKTRKRRKIASTTTEAEQQQQQKEQIALPRFDLENLVSSQSLNHFTYNTTTTTTASTFTSSPTTPADGLAPPSVCTVLPSPTLQQPYTVFEPTVQAVSGSLAPLITMTNNVTRSIYASSSPNSSNVGTSANFVHYSTGGGTSTNEEAMDHVLDLRKSSSPGKPCMWCGKHSTFYNTIENGFGTEFCSEVCFDQFRRDSFKKRATCIWCNNNNGNGHGQLNINLTTNLDESKFCSDNCLAQFKVRLFCEETSAQLEHIKSTKPNVESFSTISNVSSSNNSGTIKDLITPDLWLKKLPNNTNFNDIVDENIGEIKDERRSPSSLSGDSSSGAILSPVLNLTSVASDNINKNGGSALTKLSLASSSAVSINPAAISPSRSIPTASTSSLRRRRKSASQRRRSSNGNRNINDTFASHNSSNNYLNSVKRGSLPSPSSSSSTSRKRSKIHSDQEQLSSAPHNPKLYFSPPLPNNFSCNHHLDLLHQSSQSPNVSNRQNRKQHHPLVINSPPPSLSPTQQQLIPKFVPSVSHEMPVGVLNRISRDENPFASPNFSLGFKANQTNACLENNVEKHAIENITKVDQINLAPSQSITISQPTNFPQHSQINPTTTQLQQQPSLPNYTLFGANLFEAFLPKAVVFLPYPVPLPIPLPMFLDTGYYLRGSNNNTSTQSQHQDNNICQESQNKGVNNVVVDHDESNDDYDDNDDEKGENNNRQGEGKERKSDLKLDSLDDMD